MDLAFELYVIHNVVISILGSRIHDKITIDRGNNYAFIVYDYAWVRCVMSYPAN